MNMGGSIDPNFKENDEGFEQDVAHPKSGDNNVEHINNVNSNSNTSIVFIPCKVQIISITSTEYKK